MNFENLHLDHVGIRVTNLDVAERSMPSSVLSATLRRTHPKFRRAA
jgi:hypothetical protein